jgi:anti-anti-sigma regulatory factor
LAQIVHFLEPMTLRITRLDDQHGTIIKVDGWLQAEGVSALEQELECAYAGRPLRLTLDLGGLRQADEAAVDLLCKVAATGAELTACPHYLALRLAQ